VSAPGIGRTRQRLRAQRVGAGIARMPGAAVTSAVVLLALVVAAVLADVLRPLDTVGVSLGGALQPPSAAHPMGTDPVGRDLAALTLHGLRVSFGVSVAAAVVAAVLGGAVGTLAGTLGGRVDAVLMRVVDVFASQNHFLFGLLLIVLIRPAVGPAVAVLLAVAVTHWVPIARIVRSELLSLRTRPYVLAAIGAGASRWQVARTHLLPQLFPAIGLGFVLLVPHAIFHESGYSFLGIGMPPTSASLGNLLADSQRSLLLGGWWATVFPGAMIFLASASVGTLGQWARDRHDPRARSELER
jgi:peptide/nickel transport system permease protein